MIRIRDLSTTPLPAVVDCLLRASANIHGVKADAEHVVERLCPELRPT